MISLWYKNRGMESLDHYVDSVPLLFSTMEQVVNSIDPEKRVNCYYTLNHTLDRKAFGEQEVIPIDIDHVLDGDRDKVVDLVTSYLNLSKTKTGIVYSGHGVQFIIKVDKWTEISFFESNRLAYKAMCDSIQFKLEEAKLSGEVDPVVFSPNRLMRLGFTMNHKEGMPPVQAILIQGNIEAQDFQLAQFVSDTMPIVELRQHTSIDKEGVLKCPFLQNCINNPATIPEPEWMAMIGVIAWIPEDGYEMCHTFSEGHPKYKRQETDKYITRVLKMTGPRTCKSIGALSTICASCPYAVEVNTPLQIKSEDYIASQDNGFHSQKVNSKGEVKMVPEYIDLMKHFKKEHNYVVEARSKGFYIWSKEDKDFFGCDIRKGCWTPIGEGQVKAYAEAKFVPRPKEVVRTEFLNACYANNLINGNKFTNVEGKINFRNGVYDIKEDKFYDHSPDFGFTYSLDFDFNADARCPRWNAFLNEVLDDADTVQLVMEFIAHAAGSIPNSEFQKVLLCIGEGANGKSVLLNTVRNIFGKTNCSYVKLKDMTNPLSLYSTMHKLVNLGIDENPKALIEDSSIFKQFVAGETLECRQLYQQMTTFTPTAKMMMAINKLPKTTDFSSGFFRRFLIVNFGKSFEGKENFKLESELYAEKAGIWNEIISSYRTLVKRGCFKIPESVNKSVSIFKREADIVSQFVDDHIEFSETDLPTGSQVTKEQVYREFCMYSEFRGYSQLSLIEFCKRLKTVLPNLKDERRYVNRAKQGFYTNLILNTGSEI